MEESGNILPKKKSRLKRVFKFLGALLLLVIILAGSLIGLLFYYEDDVKVIVVTELNKHLNAEVKIEPDNIDITILKSFPDCSIEFTDIVMLEALKIKRRDTLLYAKRLNLYFNVKDIWNKKYNIKRIKVTHGLINLLVLKDGRVNYEFWKSETPAGVVDQPDSLSFALNSILVEDCRFRYKDRQLLFKTEVQIKELELSGNFKEDSYELQLSGESLIHNVVQGQKTYLKQKKLTVDLSLDVVKDLFSLKRANMKVNKLAIQMSGKVNYGKSLESLELLFNAPDLDISSMLSLLPDELKNNFNDYQSEGNFFARGTLNYTQKNSYDLKTTFGIKNAEVIYRPNGTKAERVNLEGSLSLNEKSSQLELKHVHLMIGNDALKGQCRISDFKNPHISLIASANMDLKSLIEFYPIDTIALLSGRLNVSAEINGLSSELKSSTFGQGVTLTLKASADSLRLQFKGDEKLFALQSGSIEAVNREVEVKNFKLLRGNSDVLVNGKIPGMFNYLVDRKSPLIIVGAVYSENLNLEDFLITYNSSATKEEPIIQDNIIFQLDAKIQKFSYANFKAEKISGDIEIKNQKAIVSDMKLSTLEGEAEIDAFFDNSKGRLDVVLQSRLNNINITELFTQFNNFGQSTLIDKNLKGYAFAKVDFSGTWSNSLEPDYNSITSTCDLSIERGELIEFKPLLSLSKFVDVKDLQHIRFSKLQSTVEISKQLITLPKTTIKNSALNIDFWGSHSFDNEIDYHIQLLISDLLAKKRKNKHDEFGVIENDPENRRSAFVRMTGTVDNPIIKYDKQALKEKIKHEIKQEKQNIKQLLKEEFGIFKKDSAIRKKTKQETTFELENPNKVPAKKPLEPKKKEEDDDDF